MSLCHSEDLEDLARRCPGFLLEDLAFLLRCAEQSSHDRLVRGKSQELASMVGEGLLEVKVGKEDFAAALRQAQDALADAAGAPKIPEVTWEDVGNLVGYFFKMIF